MIKYICPACHQKLGVPDNYAGRRVRCNKCSAPSIVPKPITEVVITPAAAPAAQPHPAPAAKPSAMPPQVELLETLDIVSDADIPAETDPNAEILRQARLEKASREFKAAPKKSKTKSSDTSARPGESDSGGFSLTDIVPDVLHLPLSIVLACLFAGVLIVVWCAVTRATEKSLFIFEMFIPLAAAAGIRLLAVNRTFVHGLLALVIGLAAIAIGRSMMTKQVVIPYLHKQANQEVLVDLKATQSDPKYQPREGESVSFIAKDGDFMQCVALIAAVDQTDADPKIARKLAVQTLRASNKTNLIEYLANASSSTAGRSRPEPTDAEMDVLSKADSVSAPWEEDIDLRDAARKYYPALAAIFYQADTQRKLEAPDGGFRFALLNSLGLLEVFWIFIGLSGAYSMSVFES